MCCGSTNWARKSLEASPVVRVPAFPSGRRTGSFWLFCLGTASRIDCTDLKNPELCGTELEASAQAGLAQRSPNHINVQLASSETAGTFFYFMCAEISFAEMWKEEARGWCGPTGPDLSSPSGSYSIRGGGLKRLTN
jgi:hypothetical protein